MRSPRLYSIRFITPKQGYWYWPDQITIKVLKLIAAFLLDPFGELFDLFIGNIFHRIPVFNKLIVQNYLAVTGSFKAVNVYCVIGFLCTYMTDSDRRNNNLKVFGD